MDNRCSEGSNPASVSSGSRSGDRGKLGATDMRTGGRGRHEPTGAGWSSSASWSLREMPAGRSRRGICCGGAEGRTGGHRGARDGRGGESKDEDEETRGGWWAGRGRRGTGGWAGLMGAQEIERGGRAGCGCLCPPRSIDASSPPCLVLAAILDLYLQNRCSLAHNAQKVSFST